jgi:hypothetical protein
MGDEREVGASGGGGVMTQEQQRIAIAEWMGWIYHGESSRKKEADTFYWKHNEKEVMYQKLPNYPEDLNAMHEAEEKLDRSQFMRYYSKLLGVIIGVDKSSPEESYLNSPLTSSQMAVIAPPAQRSEAICRTLWPERWGG